MNSVEKGTDSFMSEMTDYLENPADGAVVVLRHAGGVRGKKLLEAIRSGRGSGIEIVCAEIKKDAEKYAFAQSEFATAQRAITPGALRAITAAFSESLAELAAACQQLMSDSSEKITEVTVEKYYAGRIEVGAFHVVDVALSGRTGEALVMMRHALASGADPVPMVAAFASKIRTMAKLSGVRGSNAEIASDLGLAPWQVDRARRDIVGWTEVGLGRCVEALAEADAGVKGAARDSVYALERVVALVATKGAGVSR